MSFIKQTHFIFPRSQAYHSEWVIESASGGANSILLVEWLTAALELKPGMKILDLGCGRAASSVFLAREYGVTVWATDLWFSPSENLQRIRNAGFAENIFPIHSDARNLPYADDFFDAILSIDAFPYFGTDDHYLNYLARFVKPNGIIAIAGSGFLQEIESTIPSQLSELLAAEPSMLSMHSSPWWRRHWEKAGIVDVELADSMPDGWQLWLEWLETIAPDNRMEIEAVRTDVGRYLGYNRIVSRRRADACLNPPIVAIPANYTRKPLLRDNLSSTLR
ncbi:MAG TPA: SAM-dependent methyltransferase [Planctomycetaceae bacterium]|nr:SAM-dependent methyltransferase [Planctomycetaceae bacterium]